MESNALFYRQGAYRLVFLLVICASLLACRKNNTKPINTEVPGEEGTAIPDKLVINGYTDKQSYNVGDSVALFLSTQSVIVKRALNVYNLDGKIMFSVPVNRLTKQEASGEKPYEDGFGYSDPVTFKVPTLKSGTYLVANQIPLIVKSKDETVDFTVVYPYNTENAYCATGRRSLYTTPVAKIVSFQRPIPYSAFAAGFLKWIGQQSYSYNMISDIDLEDYDNIKGKIVVIIGHSEYWSRKARRNFDRFIDEGKNAIVLSGNTMWWQVRYNEDKTKLICYKAVGEPRVADSLKTWLWISPSLRYQITESIGVDYDRGGNGSIATKNDGWDGFKIVNPNSPLLTGMNLKKGDIIKCPSNEYDGAPLKGFDSEGTPIIDNKALKFDKVELIGYDFGFRSVKTVPTAIIFRKRKKSGIVVTFPSTNWCTIYSYKTFPNISKVTQNAIDGIMANKNLFSN